MIHNTWLYEQLRLKARLFESLASVSQTINSTLNLDDALQRHHPRGQRADAGQGVFADAAGREPRVARIAGQLRRGRGVRQPAAPERARRACSGSWCGRKKPLQVENVQVSSRYQSVEVARREGLVALLSVPLLYGGQAIGTLSVYTGQPYSFSNEEIRILSALAELSAIAIEKARLYERVVDVEEQLRQNEKLSALGLLAAEVAHEIRNPLTVLKMLYHSLDLRFPPADPRAKDARIIEEKIGQLNRIVEQILDFARTTEPALAPVNLNGLVEELGLLVRHKLKHQNIQLTQDLEPYLPAVLGAATQLEQAFLNLILNAAEAMPVGGTLTITSRQLRSPRGGVGPAYVAVEFRDTGQGMSEEQRRHVFTSVLNTTKAKGTGLGLAIVARIVEAHRGKVRIRSRLGRGTTVSVILPRQPLEGERPREPKLLSGNL